MIYPSNVQIWPLATWGVPLGHGHVWPSEDKDISQMEEAHERKEFRCPANFDWWSFMSPTKMVIRFYSHQKVPKRNALVFSLMNLKYKH